MVERCPCKADVSGSSPLISTKDQVAFLFLYTMGTRSSQKTSFLRTTKVQNRMPKTNPYAKNKVFDTERFLTDNSYSQINLFEKKNWSNEVRRRVDT